MQLSELKKEMRFNGELLSLVDTLKSIASSRYHALEKEKERFELFMTSFASFFRVVDLVEVNDPLVRVTTDILGLVIVTSDSGFMGGLNSGVMNAAFQVQGNLSNDKTQLIVIGEKGAAKIADLGRTFKFFRGIAHETRYEQAVEMAQYLVGEVKEGRIGRLVLAYPRPLSFSQQVVETINVLPCAELFDRAAQSEISERVSERRLLAEARKVIVESTFKDMVEYLARTWVTSKLYEVFEDSKLAEFGARAIHLEGSHQKVEKVQKKLQHRYFKASHERIDKGMRESYSAGNIRKKKDKAAAKAAAAVGVAVAVDAEGA